MKDANVDMPKPGQRVILIRDGRVVNLLPVFVKHSEYLGWPTGYHITYGWDFPLENGQLTTNYCQQENLSSLVRDGDYWMPIPSID